MKSEPNTERDDKWKLTGVGCFITLVSVAIIFCVAIPIVQWRDAATGRPLPRTISIVSPILIGAAFHGIASAILKLVGFPVWSMPDKDESNLPEE